MKNSFNPEYLKQRFPNHKITFVKNEQIGNGFYGSIISSIFGINKNKYPVVIKKFKNVDDVGAEEFRNLNYNVWKFLKSNQIPTFKRYKKYENESIVMDNLSSDTKFCVSPENFSELNLDATYLMKNRIEEI